MGLEEECCHDNLSGLGEVSKYLVWLGCRMVARHEARGTGGVGLWQAWEQAQEAGFLFQPEEPLEVLKK